MSAEFQEVIRTELPETGDQREQLQAEADRVFGYAEQYVKQMEQKQKEEQERERIRQEELKVKEQQIRQTVAEVEKLLVKAEEEAQKARSVTEQLYQLVNSANSANSAPRESLAASFPARAEEALRTGKTASRLGQVAQKACEACWKFLDEHRMQIFEHENLRHEVAQFVQRSEQRMQHAQMAASQAVKLASETKERICNSAAPSIWDKKNGEIFRRYDQDEDGMLSRSEVTNFSKLEYGFAIPKANLERIFTHFAPFAGSAASGLEPTRFQQLRTAVGIARFEARAKAAKSTEDEETKKQKDQVEAEYQNNLKQRQNAIASEVEAIWNGIASWKDLDTKIADVESTSASFVKAASSDVGQEELQRFEAAFDGALSAARTAISVCLFQLRQLRHQATELSMHEKTKTENASKEDSKMKQEEAPSTEEKKEQKEKGENPENEKKGEESKDEKEKDEKEKEKKEEKEKEKLANPLTKLKEKLTKLARRLSKLEARLVLSEKRASEGRKVTAKILAHKAEELVCLLFFEEFVRFSEGESTRSKGHRY